MIIHPAGKFDNHAQQYQTIDARPLAAAMGAEICGADLANVSETQFGEIEHALFHHKMIYFRDQHISHADHENFSRRFGPFAEDAYTNGIPGYVNVQPVIREADHKAAMVFGAGWHTDSPFLAQPPAISTLYGVDIPPYGGDTMWANAALAYRCLSKLMQQTLQPFKVHMSIAGVIRLAGGVLDPDESPMARMASQHAAGDISASLQDKLDGALHPLVREHARTGEKSLYCDQTYTAGIDGLTEHEARPILEFLLAHITQPAFTCRLRWAPNTFVIWDNRLCIHQAFNDHDGYRREMYRTTIAGAA